MLPEGTRIDARHDDGSPSRITLTAPAKVDGVSCAACIVHLHPNGRLASATVTGPSVVQGWSLGDGDQVSMHENGVLASLTFERVRRVDAVDGVHFVVFDDAGRVSELWAASSVLDASGTLLRRMIGDAPETVHGVVCASVAFFYPNGQLRSAYLGAPLVTPRGTIPVGSSVTFDERGTLTKITLGAATEIDGHLYEAGTGLALDGAAPREVPTWTFSTP